MTDQVNILEEPDVDYFDYLVGEDKQYSSPQELAKGKLNADQRIESLKSDLERSDERFELLFNMYKNRDEVDEEDASPVSEGTQETTTVDIEKSVRNALSKVEQEKRADANRAEANDKLTKKYNSYEEGQRSLRTFYDLHPELKQEMERLRMTSPDAFMRLYNSYDTPGVQATTSPGTHGRSSADAVVSSKGGLTWDKISHIFKTDKDKYYSPEFQAEIQKAAEDGTLPLEDFEGSPM